MGIEHVAFSDSSAAAHVLRAADDNQPITLLAVTLFAAGAVSLTFSDGSNNLSGAFPATATLPLVASCSEGLCKAPAGSPLKLTLSAGVAVTGFVTILVGEPSRQTL